MRATISPITERFVRRVVQVRRARGISQESLAGMSGVPRPVIANIESGRRVDIGLAQAELICRALSVDMAEMVRDQPLTITLSTEVVS